MKVLVVHPEDSPFERRWAAAKWDVVVDLGFAGPGVYQEWSERLGCRVGSLSGFRRPDDAGYLRSLLDFTRGRVRDDLGLDWWELNSVFFYEPLEQVMLLAHAAEEWGGAREIAVSRPGLAARVLERIFGERVRVVGWNRWARAASRVEHYGRVLSKFSLAQLGEILGDKYDPSYSWRRHFAGKAVASSRPVVLVPSAYSNASKVVAAYARMIPEQEFLLVTTRRSATLVEALENMEVVPLASYAEPRRTDQEFEELLKKWDGAAADIQGVPELQLFKDCGGFRAVPQLIATGLGVRDAWLGVFARHKVRAVFSGDEGNPYVCIPLRVAAERGIPSVSVHHGALDGRFLLREPAAELVLAKSRMEADYLVRVCGVNPERVAVGGPAVQNAPDRKSAGAHILFISEPYEVAGGRSEEIYRELLPGLCRVAGGCRVIVKLHPFESLRERRRLVEKLLSPADREIVEVVSGPMGDLIAGAWFAVTVQSTVAVECAVQGIPCFLCGWLAESMFDYAGQFEKFGAGYGLGSAEEISRIPEVLSRHSVSEKQNLGSVVSPEKLREFLKPVSLRLEKVALSG